MEIEILRHNGESYSNYKVKKMEFKNVKERMTYVVNFLNDKANAKTSKDSPSHLKGAKFMFLKPAGNFFDTINFTIGDSKPGDVEKLMKIVFN